MRGDYPRAMPPSSKVAPEPLPTHSPDALIHTRTICVPAERVYEFCLDVENLPLFIDEPVAVSAVTKKSITASVGGREETTVRLTGSRANRSLSWETEPGDNQYQGTLILVPAPGDEGTEITLTVRHRSFAGGLGKTLDKLKKTSPDQRVADALRRLKALLEAGEIPTIEGQPVGEPQKSKGKK